MGPDLHRTRFDVIRESELDMRCMVRDMKARRAAREELAVRLQRCGVRGDVGGDDVVRADLFEVVEPEERDLREHLALVRDRIGQDAVERRQAVRRHKQQRLAQVEDLAHLAALEFRQVR